MAKRNKKPKSEGVAVLEASRLAFRHMKDIPLPKSAEQVDDYIRMLYDKILKEESVIDESKKD